MGGKLKNRCVFYCGEFGTLPKIESAEMMFSASRSRRLQIVPIIQSFAQLNKNYGKEGAEIIIDNTQLTILGEFAPGSNTATELSGSLGKQTVTSGSISCGEKPQQTLQMIQRDLMTPDELKSMPKGQFIIMKTGCHSMKTNLSLYFKWGIEFDENHPFIMADNGNRPVKYTDKLTITNGIRKAYPKTEQQTVPAETNAPSEPPKKPEKKKGLRTEDTKIPTIENAKTQETKKKSALRLNNIGTNYFGMEIPHVPTK